MQQCTIFEFVAVLIRHVQLSVDYINFVNIGGNNGIKSENTSSDTQTPQTSNTVAPDEEISMGKVPVSVGAPTPAPVTEANSEDDELPF